MFRLLVLLAAVALAGWGLMWLADNPGWVTVTWGGVEYRLSLMVALGLVAAVAIVWSIIWGLMRFFLRAPSLMSLGARSRRREKGLRAVSRGLIAVNTGDTRLAAKHAAEANRLLAQEPITKILTAQAAQLVGDRPAAVAAYNAMLENQETHGLGLRGLHIEARREGDYEAALQYAVRANARAPAAWAGQAVLEDRTRRGDWAGALATVDSNAAAKLIDKPTAQRWRAVIKTAMALETQERDPKGAMALAQEACRASPSLVPAAALYGRLAGVGGDYRRATKAIEVAYAQTPHPDLAAAYLRVRHGDSTGDRLARARSLARAAPNDPELMLTVGRAALEDHDLRAARAAIAPLLASDSPHGRPTRRVCLLMADIETVDGNQGAVREWLSRAARAPRDKAWVADGVISDRWAPVSPSGALDAFVWRTPDERLTALPEPDPIEPAQPAPRRRACRPRRGGRAGRCAASRRPGTRAAADARAAGRGDPDAAYRGGSDPQRPRFAAADLRGASRRRGRSGQHGAGRSRPGRTRAAAPPILDLRRRLSAASSPGERDGPVLRRHRRRRARRRAGGGQPARSGYDGAIVLLSDESELPYQRPPLSKAFLKREMELHGLPLRAEAFYRDQRIDLQARRPRDPDRPRGPPGGDRRRLVDRLRPSDSGDRGATAAPRRPRRRSRRAFSRSATSRTPRLYAIGSPRASRSS